jgi:ATP-dependent DNA helicase 2 subunit 1
VETWNEILKADDRADVVVAKKTTGTKRKAADTVPAGGIDDTEIRTRYEENLLDKVSVPLEMFDEMLTDDCVLADAGRSTQGMYTSLRIPLSFMLRQEFLRSKSQPVSGKKADLVERVAEYLTKHS